MTIEERIGKASERVQNYWHMMNIGCINGPPLLRSTKLSRVQNGIPLKKLSETNGSQGFIR